MSVGCACAESVALIQPRPSIQVIRVKKKKGKPPTGHYARGYGQKNDGRTKRDSKTFPIVGARRTLARSRAAALLPIKEALLCRVVLLLRLCVASSEADKPGRSSSRIAPTYSKSNAANRGNRSEQEPSRYAQRTPIGGRGPRLLWLLAAEGSESTRALAPLSPLSALALALPVRLRT